MHHAQHTQRDRCCVPGCRNDKLMLVAANGSLSFFMCVRHATEWMDSPLSDLAVRDDCLAYLETLTTWLKLNWRQRGCAAN